MPANSQDRAFAQLLWSRPVDLAPMFGLVVRGGLALGPIALGDLGKDVQARLTRLPKGPDGYKLQLEPEHRAEPGYASGTDAYHLTAYSLAEAPNEPQCWIEWSCDPETDRVIHVRFCVIFEPATDDLHEQIVAGFRTAFDGTYGAGKERKKKPKKNAVRPVDWTLDGAVLTLGCFDAWGRRYVVCELTDAAWADHDCLQLPAFREA